MAETHTPGRWVAEEAPKDWTVMHINTYGLDPDGSGMWLADVSSFNPADARLIAAAPDLLAALRALDMAVSHCTTIGELYPHSDMQRLVRAALERAEGTTR